MSTFVIDITSDIVCPYCYLGYARLSKAIESYKKINPNDTFKLIYHPFYLTPAPQVSNPSLPPFPVETRPHIDLFTHIGAEKYHQAQQMIKAQAAKMGLDFHYEKMLAGPSRNGHRLIYYAGTHGGVSAQEKVMLGLWTRYFEKSIDITKLETLVEVGVEAGVGSAEEIEKYLLSGDDGVTVDKEVAKAMQKGIHSVPNYTINGSHQIPGGQEPEVWIQAFQRIKQQEAANGK